MKKFWNVQSKVLRLVLLAMFTAAIAVATAYVSIPTGMGGYIHIGDGIIFMGAMLLGPAGAIAAGVGSALADILCAYAVFAPGSFVVKAVMGVIVGIFYRRKDGIASAIINIVLFIVAEMVMIIGYFGYECILWDFNAALAEIPANAVQACAGIIIGAVSAPLVKKIKL